MTDGGEGAGQVQASLKETDIRDLQPTERPVEAARAKARRSLLFLGLLLLVAILQSVLSDDWIWLALVALVGFGAVQVVREIRRPERFLQLSPDELAVQVLERRHSWETLPSVQEQPAKLIAVQDLLDRLSPGGTLYGRKQTGVMRWACILGAVAWGGFGIVGAVSGAGFGALLMGSGMAGVFGWAAYAAEKRHARCREAETLLEQIAGRGPPSEQMPET